ncbi:MAG: hypothetical protein HKP43_02465 [Altererythrobacter sp.]|nr:hypothetical protein [Altererythrobacter sp.]MBT8432054.1 hypothetical protein [Altererythrobacter sp.]NNE50384.1 hypothetical protein [Altererythrobacter sp.]NNF93849.1 hypothetical protein [Altererythrobacter sp.]NNK45473.1 hypothetical protein [Altererythrobacter sp.]
MTANPRANGFFNLMGWVLMVLVVSGFGIVQVLTPELTSPMRLTLALHALIFLSWFALLIIQPRLIAQGNYARHKQIGQLSIGLAIALVVMGVLITREAYLRPGWSIAGMGPQSSIMFPFTDLVFFSILYWLAYAKRTEAQAHKRLMLFAGIVMLDPALARLFTALGLPPPFITAVELGLVIAVMIHDRKSLGGIHWATWLGLALLAAVYPLAFGFSQTAAWTSMVTAVLGSPPPI